MLERISFKNIGPSPEMSLDFGQRLNLLTGDNGLGKTFVLDAAWWALTRTWADGRVFLPDSLTEADLLLPDPEAADPEIEYVVWGVDGPTEPARCVFNFERYEWGTPWRRPPIPGLIVYARVDGGFSIWDPARNYWRTSEDEGRADMHRPSAYQFSREQIWTGLWRSVKDEYEKNRDALVCRGLLEDLVSWQLDPGEAETLNLFQAVLKELSPHPDELLRLCDPVEQWDHPGKEPALRVGYTDHPVPLRQASAGIKRAVAFAYALVWAWVSHNKALRQTRKRSTVAPRIVLLFDEIEAHLHPQWQRRILPALLRAVSSRLLASTGVPVQIIGTTHAPLVLASVETEVNQEKDRLFNFDLEDGQGVRVEEIPWAKFGDASGWLTSPVFGMSSGYSVPAERAILAADDLMAGLTDRLPEGLRTVDEVHGALIHALDGSDPYWGFWLPYYQENKRAVP